MKSGTSLLILILIASSCGSRDLLSEIPDAGVPDAACCGQSIVYLNRAGGTYIPGPPPSDSAANTTPLFQQEQTVPPLAATEQEWSGLRLCVQEFLVAYDVQVTDRYPGVVDHIEIAVSNDSSSVGFPNTGAIVTADCQPGPREIGFAFTSDDPEGIGCAQVIWAVGAITGLDHSYACEDAMSALTGCGDKAFLDEEVPCGQFEPEECRCGGSTQNTHEHLLTHFGPAGGSP